jgi:hypothetical protein
MTYRILLNVRTLFVIFCQMKMLDKTFYMHNKYIGTIVLSVVENVSLLEALHLVVIWFTQLTQHVCNVYLFSRKEAL